MGGLASIPYTPKCSSCRKNIGNWYIDRKTAISWLEESGITPLFSPNPSGPVTDAPYYWCHECHTRIRIVEKYKNSNEFKTTKKMPPPDLFFSEDGFTRHHS